jgi:hypothetical protein
MILGAYKTLVRSQKEFSQTNPLISVYELLHVYVTTIDKTRKNTRRRYPYSRHLLAIELRVRILSFGKLFQQWMKQYVAQLVS